VWLSFGALGPPAAGVSPEPDPGLFETPHAPVFYKGVCAGYFRLVTRIAVVIAEQFVPFIQGKFERCFAERRRIEYRVEAVGSGFPHEGIRVAGKTGFRIRLRNRAGRKNKGRSEKRA